MATAATDPPRSTDSSLATLLEMREHLTVSEWAQRLVDWMKIQEESMRRLKPEDPRRKRLRRRCRIARRLLNRTRVARPADELSRERVA